MNFHNITTCDMLNGNGLRVVLWLAGCEMKCKNCQNPITWDPDGGIQFDEKAKDELFSYLEKDYIDGITFSGGHPLHEKNVRDVYVLIKEIRNKFPNKTIWLYTGYTYEHIMLNFINSIFKNDTLPTVDSIRANILLNCDIVVDGPFIEELKDENYHWAGSTNQRVIDMKKSGELYKKEVVEKMDFLRTYSLNKLKEIVPNTIVLLDDPLD